MDTLKPLQDRPGYLDGFTVPDPLPLSPFRPIDCWLVMKELEIVRTSGLVLPKFGVDKDREINCVVLTAGPGWRVEIGKYPKVVEGGLVPNAIKRGDVVHILENAGRMVAYHGLTYVFIESHKVLFNLTD